MIQIPSKKSKKPSRWHTCRGFLAVSLSVVALSACTATIESRGYIPDKTLLSEILPGVDNQQSVRQTLGYPTSTATFDAFTWYYISRRTENFLFFDEQLVDQSVVEIHFDPQGLVTAIDTIGVDKARVVAANERETETGGRKLSFFEQVFGNMGRFGNRGIGYGDPFENTGI
jgi:outer membrane protein assembly factor BamE (lipoprotein component of BamABCDE complex)